VVRAIEVMYVSCGSVSDTKLVHAGMISDIAGRHPGRRLPPVPGDACISVAAGSRGGACPTGRTRRGPVLRFVAAVDLDQLLTVPVIR